MSGRARRLASELRKYRDIDDEYRETGSRDAECRRWEAARDQKISEQARRTAIEESAGRLEDQRRDDKERMRKWGIDIQPQQEK